MEFLTREQIIHELQESFHGMMNQYPIDNIGIFEEEGQDDRYYMGYTVKKRGKTYHIHSPYLKNGSGGLTPVQNEWTVESDEPQKEDLKGIHDLESVFREI
jgi:ABC-type amino acid transport substrate-binding protein